MVREVVSISFEDFDEYGQPLGTNYNAYDQPIYFDGEEVRDRRVKGWGIESYRHGRILVGWHYGASPIHGSKEDANLVADILGDWREEVIFRNSNNRELIIFTSWYPTARENPTLMHDKTYRMGIVTQNVGYNQSAHVGYYFRDGYPDHNITMIGTQVGTPDCNGTLGGTAYLDDCKRCVEGTTDLMPCATGLEEGYYQISAVHSALCLQNNNPITQEVCTDTDSQYWHVKKNGDAYQVSSVNSKAYMSGGNNTLEGNTSMSVSPVDLILSEAGNGNFLISPTSHQNLFFDVFALLPDAGERLILWENTGATNQHFTFTKVDLPVDCHGDLYGTAYLDDCEICVAGNTNAKPCVGTIEAEAPCTIDGVALETTNPNYSGSGYANTNNTVGAYVSWLFDASSVETVTFTFRYANGGAATRDGNVLVNGTAVGLLRFPSTGSWSTWEVASINVPVTAGANEVLIEAVSADGLANIDLIHYSAGVEDAQCIVTNANEALADEFGLYPNPTSSFVHFNSEYSWELFNAKGVVLKSGKGKEVNLEDQTSGTFFIKINDKIMSIIKE